MHSEGGGSGPGLQKPGKVFHGKSKWRRLALLAEGATGKSTRGLVGDGGYKELAGGCAQHTFFSPGFGHWLHHFISPLRWPHIINSET